MLLLTKVKLFRFLNLLILSVPDEGYSRNASCVLHLIYMVLLHVSFNSSCSFNRSIKYIQCLSKLLTNIITYGINGHPINCGSSLIECNNVIYESYLYYILIEKQYDICGRLLGNPRDFYYLHYILIQKRYDIIGRFLCNPRDVYYLHYILIQKRYDIS